MKLQSKSLFCLSLLAATHAYSSDYTGKWVNVQVWKHYAKFIEGRYDQKEIISFPVQDDSTGDDLLGLVKLKYADNPAYRKEVFIFDGNINLEYGNRVSKKLKDLPETKYNQPEDEFCYTASVYEAQQ